MTFARAFYRVTKGKNSPFPIVLNDNGVIVSSEGVTRCDLNFKRDGLAGVNISSSQDPTWFDLEYPVTYEGVSTKAIRVDLIDTSQDLGRYEVDVFVWDADSADGRYAGTIDVEIEGPLSTPLGALASDIFGNWRLPHTTPAIITSDVDDYSVNSNAHQRLSSDDEWTMTGLGYIAGGQFRLLSNVGVNNIILAHENVNSTALNRFITNTGVDFVLRPQECVILIYDSVTNRWRMPPPNVPFVRRTPAEELIGVPIADYELLEGNIKRYGAVGDGVADDREAIQNAVLVNEAGGAPVYVPGTDDYYRITDHIWLVGPCHVYGDGYKSYIKNEAVVNTNLENTVFILGGYSSTGSNAPYNETFYDIDDTTPGDNQVVLTTAAEDVNFSVGDVVFIKGSAFDSGPGHNVPLQQNMNKITGISSGTLTMKYPIHDEITGGTIAASGSASLTFDGHAVQVSENVEVEQLRLAHPDGLSWGVFPLGGMFECKIHDLWITGGEVFFSCNAVAYTDVWNIKASNISRKMFDVAVWSIGSNFHDCSTVYIEGNDPHLHIAHGENARYCDFNKCDAYFPANSANGGSRAAILISHHSKVHHSRFVFEEVNAAREPIILNTATSLGCEATEVTDNQIFVKGALGHHYIRVRSNATDEDKRNSILRNTLIGPLDWALGISVDADGHARIEDNYMPNSRLHLANDPVIDGIIVKGNTTLLDRIIRPLKQIGFTSHNNTSEAVFFTYVIDAADIDAAGVGASGPVGIGFRLIVEGNVTGSAGNKTITVYHNTTLRDTSTITATTTKPFRIVEDFCVRLANSQNYYIDKYFDDTHQTMVFSTESIDLSVGTDITIEIRGQVADAADTIQIRNVLVEPIHNYDGVYS